MQKLTLGVTSFKTIYVLKRAKIDATEKKEKIGFFQPKLPFLAVEMNIRGQE